MPKQIVKGGIGNALTSLAPDHILGVAQDIFDEELQMYQSEINSSSVSYDISANHLIEGNPTPYADLAAALGINGANVPESMRKGGMSIKFIRSSDNKYVQARCMAQNFTTDVTQWQGVDETLTAGSQNLVESWGVLSEFQSQELELTGVVPVDWFVTSGIPYYGSDGSEIANDSRRRTNYIKVKEGDAFAYNMSNSDTVLIIAAFNNGVLDLTHSVAGAGLAAEGTYTVPAGVTHIQFCNSKSHTPVITKTNAPYFDNVPTKNSGKMVKSGGVFKYVNGQNNYVGISPIETLKPEYCRKFDGYFSMNGDTLKCQTTGGAYHVVSRVHAGQTISLTSADNSHKVNVFLFSSYYNENTGDISGIVLTTDSTKHYDISANTVIFTVPSDTCYLAFNVKDSYGYPSNIVIDGYDVTDGFLSVIEEYNEAKEAKWEEKTSINYLTGKKVSGIDNVKLSGFIPVKNNRVVKIYSEHNESNNYGFALFSTANEGSFVPAEILFMSAPQQGYAIIFVPQEVSYIRLTYHSTRNTNPRVEYDEYSQDEKFYGATPIKFIDGVKGSMSSSFVVGATNVKPTVAVDANYRFAEIECKAGEVYTISGVGSSSQKVYGVVDENHNVLAVGSNILFNEVITIPSGGKYLYINTLKNAAMSYRGNANIGNVSIWQGTENEFDLLDVYLNDRIFLGHNSRVFATDNDNVVKEAVRNFMKVDYGDDLVNYSRSYASYYNKSDHPRPVLIQATVPDTYYNGSIFKLYDEDNNLVYTETTSESIHQKTFKVWNLEPHKTYCWGLMKTNGTTFLTKGAVTPQGYPRFVRVMAPDIANRVDNVRDLGGWPVGVDKRVKYGILFRGSDMNYFHTINQDGIDVMLNDLHIGYDMDLRYPTEYSPFLEESPLGNTVEWGNFPITAYTITDASGGHYADAINQIAENIDDGLVTYFHCKAGADRTGTLSLLILGLLGVSESDLSKEYELTANRNRNTISPESDRGLPNLMATIKGYTGTTLQDKIETWALTFGVTQSSIDIIRENMIVDSNL